MIDVLWAGGSSKHTSQSQSDRKENVTSQVSLSLLPSFLSLSAVAATTPTTGRRACTFRRSSQTAGWCPTAAVKASPPSAAGETTPPTSTKWRSSIPLCLLMETCAPLSSSEWSRSCRSCRAAASPSWSSFWQTTCWSSGRWGSDWPACRCVLENEISLSLHYSRSV